MLPVRHLYRHVVSRRTIVLALAAVILGAASSIGAQPAADPPRTILDRVFSVAQADRGEKRFQQSCGACHRREEFSGSAFSERWESRSLGDLLEYLSTTMPPGEGNQLEPTAYADLIGFFLGQNGYPVGYDELPPDRAVLDRIGIVPNPK
jgi:hypothetical protein